MKIHSLKFRMNVLYTATLSVILVLFSLFLFWGIRLALLNELDDKLEIKAEEVADGIADFHDRTTGLLRSLTGEPAVGDLMALFKTRELNLKGDYILVLDSKLKPIIVSDNNVPAIAEIMQNNFESAWSSRALSRNSLHLIKSKHERPQFLRDGVTFTNVSIERMSYRCIILSFVYKKHFRYFIQIASATKSMDDVLSRFSLCIIIGIVVILVSTSFGGYLFVSRVLKPVMAVARTANDLTHQNLSMRIDERQMDEELKSMIDSFNSMIGRLQTAFNHINDFSASVAHELKTPLAIIKGELEVALSRPRENKEYITVMTTVLEEVERLIRISGDLLLLAKLDYNPDIYQFQKLNLTQFLRDIDVHAKVLADPLGITVSLDVGPEEVFIQGDPIHLRRLFFNLLNNAIKFTGPSGKVGISLKRDPAHFEVTISDTGPGIARENLDKIFEKFYRDPAKRHEGSGLGLNIALAIARAHGADIRVQSQLGEGSRFIVVFYRSGPEQIIPVETGKNLK